MLQAYVFSAAPGLLIKRNAYAKIIHFPIIVQVSATFLPAFPSAPEEPEEPTSP